jgi:uncharacterized protein (TIGR02453 family)
MGFSEQTIEILWGLRFNNCKSWFDAHKEEYQAYVHEPMASLGNEVFRLMREHDEGFLDTPKVSRARRDTRFSKNKDPYKESKWVFFRQDMSPGIEHEKPTFFFEVLPESYTLGLGFWPPPKKMAAFRDYCMEHQAEAAGLIEAIESDGFFLVEGEAYKRPKVADCPKPLQKLCNSKNINFIRNLQHDDTLYGSELANWVASKYISLYGAYQFIRRIGD